ncbi:chorismate mutase [Kordiimonas gwangyangensis]|uniref:chorismate mutase n=2 Tax=Kordiimonas gwangyangensis TaxID=288022 RepID=UPI00192E6327|nr:chorismate mutase [Kordiimonas gwangyangensis]
MKSLKQCQNMSEVREEIDRVDREIVPLLLERLEYIKQAGHIKSDRGTVRDEWRIEDVVNKAKAKAAEHAGNESYIEDIYRHLIEWSIAHEFVVWDKVNSNDK